MYVTVKIEDFFHTSCVRERYQFSFCLYHKCITAVNKVLTLSPLSSCSLLLQICFHYPPCPPISLVAYSATPATTVYSTVVAFRFWCDGWCDGWCGDCWLPARPLVIRAPASIENRAWCLVTFSILLQKLCINVDIQPYA